MLSPSGSMRSGWRGCGAGGTAGATAEEARDSAALAPDARPMIPNATAVSWETNRRDQEGRFMGGEGWAWDQLLEGDFNDLVLKLPAQDGYRRDIRQRVVAGRALRLRKIEADLDFGKQVGTEITSKYKGEIGELGGGFKGEWKSDGVLHMSSEGTSALAIELWKYKEGGFAAAGSRLFEKVPVGPREKASK